MKKLLFAVILISTSLFSQTYLQGSDSLTYWAPQEKYVKIGIVDSLDSSTDTVRVFIKLYDGSYQLIGCQNLLTGDIETDLVPGNGNSGRYLVNEPYPINLVIERINKLNRSRRTLIWLSSSGQ